VGAADEGGGIGDLLAANTASAPLPGSGGPAQLQDLSSILQGSSAHFQIDLELAPRAIADFRHAAQAMRELMDDAMNIATVSPPGVDAVSMNVVAEICRSASGSEPGSLRWAMEQGSMRLEEAANALERSLRTYRQADENSPVDPRPLEL
jgi:hypothetical protein